VLVSSPGLFIGRQVGLALVGPRRPARRPAFHTAWLFMAVCGLAGGRALLATGTERPSGRHSYARQRRRQTLTDLQSSTKG